MPRDGRGGFVLVLALLAGCAGTRREQVPGTSSRTAPPPIPTVAVVYCADGAGGFGGTTDALRDNLGPASPVRVELVDWSHGRGRMLADHLDHPNIMDQGKRLNRQIIAQRTARPDLPLYLIGHSAGCAVVLAAAEGLKPATLERIVLLAPSVSSRYDLRPALVNSRLGIDVFISKDDWLVLGINMRISGTTDRRWGYTSGRVGFERVGNLPRDEALYKGLRQHFWDPSQAKTGHTGGHYGSFENGYLRAYVLPLLSPDGVVRK